MIDRLLIYLLVAGCVVLGAIVFVELEPAANDAASPSEPLQRSDVAPIKPPTAGMRLEELLATTLARPLFSSTRRPPQGTANDGANGSDLADARLTGIVTEPGHHVAIFAVNGAKPLTLTEGEVVSGWRIESITPHDVSLSGPSGTKTLEPKADPNLAAQPGPTPPLGPGARVPAQLAPALVALPAAPGIPTQLPPRPRRLGGRQ